jgi:type II secretory pathway component PulF
MNYYLTQEQYEQLREMADSLLTDVETGEDFAKLLDQIGNQKVSDLV